MINIKNRTVKVFVLLQQYQKSIGIGNTFCKVYWHCIAVTATANYLSQKLMYNGINADDDDYSLESL